MTGREETADSAEVSASKDECFEKVAALANEMIERHGRDFAMGTLVIAARFIAEGRPLERMASES